MTLEHQRLKENGGAISVYQLARGIETKNLLDQLLELHQICFGAYPGVIPSSREFLDWYLKRPGLGRENTLLVLDGEKIVSSLFLTLGEMYWEGDLVPVGIIDTVMNHPQYRQRGLASQLIKWAEEIMQARGCLYGYLYTLANSGPFHLYRRLGYRPVKSVWHLQYRASSSQATPWPEVTSPEMVATFLNRCFAHHNGFVPFHHGYFRWKKIQRPDILPAKILTIEENGICATLTVIRGEITTTTGKETIFYFTDWCGQDLPSQEKILIQALQCLPPQSKVDYLGSEGNQEWQILRKHGFQATLEEVAMLHPLHEEASRRLERAGNPLWYPLIESIVGA
jgi:GNAT superfamily N-acetyltransferase